MIFNLDNIAEVARDGLCTGCGTCVGVCPANAIVMGISNGLFIPEVDEEKCANCRLCLKSCPGYSVDLKRLNFEIFGKQPDDPFLGNFLRCYVGHSNDNAIRHDSSSGGTVTQLLDYALEKGIIDGALVVRMNADKPLEPEPFIARTKEEIISASKSKYCPADTNVILREILSENGRFAVVGLPCQIYGVRMAERASKELRDRIILHVGLFCGHTVSFFGTDSLLRKFGIRRDEVAKLEYRGSGWPGYMSIMLKDGRRMRVRFNRGWNAYWNIFAPFFFTPLCCMMCSDQFNELADVSVGDAWLPELRGQRLGEAVLIARTAIAEELLTSLKEAEVLSLRRISPNKAKESQGFSLNFKKENLSSRLALFGMLGYRTPYISPILHFSSFSAWLSAVLSYFSFRFSSSKRLTSILAYVPLPLFRLYFGLFKCTFWLSEKRG